MSGSELSKKFGNIKESERRGKQREAGDRRGRRDHREREQHAKWIFSTTPTKPLPDKLQIAHSAQPVSWGEELVYWVPASALAELQGAEIKPMHFWKYLYILNQIQLGYFQWRANEKNQFFTPVSSRHLDRVIHDYRKILDQLLALDIIEVKEGRYYPAFDSKISREKNGYRFTEQHWSNTIKIVHKDPKRAAKAEEMREKWRKAAIAGNLNRQHIWDTMQETTIMRDEAIDYISAKDGSSEHQTDCYMMSVDVIHTRDYYFSVDFKTGRVFNNYANLWNELRPFLRIRGEKLCEIDMANSQPLLAATLYPDGSKEKEKYLEVVLKGNFYRHLEANSGKKYPDYKHLKQQVFAQVFFGRNSKGKGRPLLRAFMKEFPQLSKIIRRTKWVRKNRLALKLQKVEADLIIDQVVAEFREWGIPCLTVHDSVICRVCDRDFVYKCMKEKLRNLIGHECE